MAYVPYGYTVKDGVITVDEKAAGQVKEFFEKYIWAPLKTSQKTYKMR